MLLRKLLATVSFALFTAASAAPPAPSGQSALVHARPALWAVRDADTTIYIFGTIHKLKSGTNWMEGRVRDALQQSGTVVVELDTSDAAAAPAALKAHSRARDGKTMIQRLPEAMRPRYLARLAELGLPEKPLDRLQPWAVASMIASVAQRKAGIVREEGVEDQLIAFVKSSGKVLTPLETLDQQFSYFEQMPETDQVSLLEAALDEGKAGERLFDTIASDWSRGRTARLMSNLASEIPAPAREVLVYRRNRSWAASLKAILDKPGTFFVAVGTGHLVGKGNLRDELRTLGVSSHRLQ